MSFRCEGGAGCKLVPYSPNGTSERPANIMPPFDDEVMKQIIFRKKCAVGSEDTQEIRKLIPIKNPLESGDFEPLCENGPFCFSDGKGHTGLNRDGYYRSGYDRDGFSRDGIDRDGFDRSGFNANGLDRDGFNRKGIDIKGFDRDGFSRDGIDRDGFDRGGFNRDGIDREGFHRSGFNSKGLDRKGFNRDGLDKDGFDRKGFNSKGLDREGFNREGFNCEGFNRKGFDREGFNREGFDSEGFDSEGFDSEGFDRSGFDTSRLDRAGFGRDGYDKEGFNKDGYNSNGISRKGFISPVKWKEIVKSTTLLPDHQSDWLAKSQYSELNEQDLEIAMDWANTEKSNDYTMARMLSARSAEKVAIKFYQSLGFEVNDVSIKQPIKISKRTSPNISEDSDDWKLYDLLLNGEISIDVKNARLPLNSKVSYVEHCVSRFKKNRDNQNVIIAGVLSPYLKLEDIKYPYIIPNELKIKYLGETTVAVICGLEERFSRRFFKLSLNSMNFIPRWMFEFPVKFYEKRNIQRSILKQVALETIPTIALCEKNGFNPIPAYLSSGINVPDVWIPELRDWQIDFYNRIRPRDDKVVSMPVLFLALLIHFLEALTQGNRVKEYEPIKYRQLFYADLPLSEIPQAPLGIFDPLGTIDSLIETLSILWNDKEHINLREFELFKFNGVGLLEGKRVHKQNYETILAYCGGFIDGKGKCGNNPLILGKHESCTECGKLICDQCGYCNSNCSMCEPRMQSAVNYPKGPVF